MVITALPIRPFYRFLALALAVYVAWGAGLAARAALAELGDSPLAVIVYALGALTFLGVAAGAAWLGVTSSLPQRSSVTAPTLPPTDAVQR